VLAFWRTKHLDHEGSREFLLEFKTLEDEGTIALQISRTDYPAELNHTTVEASQPGIVSTHNTYAPVSPMIHLTVPENCALLGHYTSSGNFLPMCQDSLSVPSSGFKNLVPVIPFISLPSTSNILLIFFQIFQYKSSQYHMKYLEVWRNHMMMRMMMIEIITCHLK